MRLLRLCALCLLFTGRALAEDPYDPTDPDDVGDITNTLRTAPTNEEALKWDYQFDSLADFTEAVRRPSLKIIATGETKTLFYVIMRRTNSLYVALWARKGGRITGQDIHVDDAKGEENVLVRDTTLSLPVALTKTSTSGPPYEETHQLQLTYVKDIKAAVFNIRPEFHGKLAFDIRVTNEKLTDAPSSITVPWK